MNQSVTNVYMVFCYNTANFAECIGTNWTNPLDLKNALGHEIVINNKTYVDKTTGYTLWAPGTSGVPCDASQFGGFSTGTFTCVIKTHYNDGTYVESTPVTATAPLNPVAPISTAPVGPAPKGKKK